MSQLLIEHGARVLFQGDSITDATRSTENDANLGAGYVNFVAAWIWAKYPDRKIEFLNRGISGSSAACLEGRWTDDCIALQPDWLSILIGINDTWREINGYEGQTVASYGETYRRILDRVKSETKARIIILEPFLLPGGTDQVGWRELLLPRIDLARAVARDYAAKYVPLDGLFAAACVQREPGFWSADRVHPTPAGHALIAQAWIDAVHE